jgi:phosphatidylserine/phosphatidylglycerophosphate/cardiolipin synthase-like enzyme
MRHVNSVVRQALTFAVMVLLVSPIGAAAQERLQERLCDTQYEDCREPLLELIRNEDQGIDVAFWYMQDYRYVHELMARHTAGVPVRIIVDQRANSKYAYNATMLAYLRDAGIPMREKYAGPDILHFKMMLFHGQDMLEFSKANYGPWAFSPAEPNVSYDDEAVFFTDDDRLTNTFRRRFEDLWTDTAVVQDFGNMTGPPFRIYPVYPIDPSMNFPPLQDFANRAVARYDQEAERIDAIVFRVYDDRQTNAMIRAVARGVPVRILTEPTEYRNPLRVYDSEHVDRMYMGGVQLKLRKHPGLLHEAAVVMHGLGEVIFGSSNWTAGSAIASDEHNFFYDPGFGKPWFFQWFADQFERKWNDSVNYVPFQPLPPGTPSSSTPINGASGQAASVTLTWDGGTWAHFYDIYLGISSTPPLLKANLQLGSPQPGVVETFTVTNLLPGTTYYWRIVGKTWAQRAASGQTWNFTTAGTAPPGGGGSIPVGGTPTAVPGTIEAENFDDGGPLVAYYDTTAGNSTGQYRSTDVDVEATSDSAGGYNLGKTRAGEWVKYTVNVATNGSYRLETRVANVGTGARFQVEVDGVDRSGPIAVPDTGGWQTWQTITTADIPLTAGARVIRVVFTTAGAGGGVGNYNWFRLIANTSSSPTTPHGVMPVPLPGIVQAENFDIGASGVAYHDVKPGNSGGAYRSTDVDIEPALDIDGGYNVGWTRAGEWLKYTANVATTAIFTLETRVANVGTGATFHVEVDGVDRTGPIAVPDTGGWQTWQTIATTSIPLTAGQRVLRVVFDTVSSGGGVGNYNWFRLESTPPTP